MIKRLIALSVLFLLIIIGCKKDDSPSGPGSTTTVIVPLKNNNTWTFIDSTFNSLGTYVSKDTSLLGITGSQTITYLGQNLETFYWNWKDLHANKYNDIRWLVRVESDGLNFYGGKSSKGTYVLGKTVSIKYPVNAGDTWTHYSYLGKSDSTFYIGDTLQCTCLATEEVFHTAVGDFKSVVVKQVSTKSTGWVLLYYAPNVGYIGLKNYSSANIVTFKKTLMAYSLN
jgi:hypothetical protein